MSYDLYLLDCPPGTNAAGMYARLEQLQALEEQHAGDLSELTARKQRIAEFIKSSNPEYQSVVRDFEAIAQAQNISEAEARRRHREIQLFDETASTSRSMTSRSRSPSPTGSRLIHRS